MAGFALTVDETVHQNVQYASNGTYSSAPLFINKSKFAVDLECRYEDPYLLSSKPRCERNSRPRYRRQKWPILQMTCVWTDILISFYSSKYASIRYQIYRLAQST